jgi:Photosynthesis system II assembly factor YCF48
MKLKIAAVAALSAGSLVGIGVAPATGSATHAVAKTSAPSLGCSSQPRPPGVAEVPGELAAVQFVSATTGWVAGADRVLATTNAGATWSVQRVARGAHYSEVDAIDSRHAWVVGRDQVIATTNGGATWRRLPEPCAAITSVHFVSPSHGFAVAGGKLLRTSDAGKKWHSVHTPAGVQSVCFTSTQLGWLGANGKIYRTVNGGRVWGKAVAGEKVHGRSNEPIAEVECAGADAGWAELIGPGAAMNQQPHIGYYLNDAGSRPIFAEQYFPHPGIKIHRESPGSEPAAFSAVDASNAVFVDWCPACGAGTAPMAIATGSGQTLDRVGRVRNINQAYGVSFASTTNGWAVGGLNHFTPHGNRVTWKIEHTTDGGKHWTTQYVE